MKINEVRLLTLFENSVLSFWYKYFDVYTHTKVAPFWIEAFIYFFFIPLLLNPVSSTLLIIYGMLIFFPSLNLLCRRWEDAGISCGFVLIVFGILPLMIIHVTYFPVTSIAMFFNRAFVIILLIINLLVTISPTNKAPFLLGALWEFIEYVFDIIIYVISWIYKLIIFVSYVIIKIIYMIYIWLKKNKTSDSKKHFNDY